MNAELIAGYAKRRGTMKLQEYDDEDLIEEIKHRGIKIEVIPTRPFPMVKIGGILFDFVE